MFKNLICAEPVHSRPPKFEGDTEATISLVRYHIKFMPWLTFNIIYTGDQQFHNHRWHFFSMLLKGSYLERWIDEEGNHYEKVRKAWRPSGFYFRDNRHFHEVVAIEGQKIYTLFFRNYFILSFLILCSILFQNLLIIFQEYFDPILMIIFLLFGGFECLKKNKTKYILISYFYFFLVSALFFQSQLA